MIEALSRLPGVEDVHDVHVWSISPELHAMSCHVLIDDLPTSEAAVIRGRVEEVLREKFDINHVTLQMECEQCDANDIYCTLKFAPHDEDSGSTSTGH